MCCHRTSAIDHELFEMECVRLDQKMNLKNLSVVEVVEALSVLFMIIF